VLDVRTDDTRELDGENLLVTRISKNIGEQSSVGGIFTSGDPAGAGTSQLGGLDANFRTSEFLGDKTLAASVWALKSDNEGIDDDDLALGASLRYPNELWSWSLTAREVQENFDPKLGFVPRRGVRDYSAGLVLGPRINRGGVRRMEFALDVSATTDRDDELESLEVRLQPFGIQLDSGDGGRIELIAAREDLREDFEIHDDVTIPAGEHDFLRALVGLETSLTRPLSANLTLEGGEFFDGRRFDASADLEWRPSAHFSGSLAYEQNEVDLDQGSFTTHLGAARLNWSFTPDLAWNQLVQFDNDSDSLGIFSRLRWILEPGRELFVVFNETLERDSGALAPTEQVIAFKLVYTLRF
jgi:hypothetical protein